MNVTKSSVLLVVASLMIITAVCITLCYLHKHASTSFDDSMRLSEHSDILTKNDSYKAVYDAFKILYEKNYVFYSHYYEKSRYLILY